MSKQTIDSERPKTKLLSLLADNSYAASFQTLGQYRSSLIKEIGKIEANERQHEQARHFSVDALVSVRDLEELIQMWKESSQIPAMVGESKESIAAKNIVYAECCQELKQLINGDKSVIEKL